MKKLLLALLLFSTLASAQSVTTVNLSWTNAIKNTDGTDISAAGQPESLLSTTIYWSICDPQDQVTITPGLDKTVSTTIPGNPEATTVDIGTPGRWCFIGIHTNLEGVSSDYSNAAIKDIITIPNPPTGLIVDPANLFAYAISQSFNVVTLVPYGTVPEGTACDGTMEVNEHYRVPREEVTWAGTAEAPVVFALCQ